MARIERALVMLALATMFAAPAAAQQGGVGAVVDTARARAQAAVDSTAARAAQHVAVEQQATQPAVEVVEQDPGLAPARPVPQGPPISADEVRLVFDREVYRYEGDGRRDPFRPLTDENASGPLFQDLKLRMIMHSEVPGQSIVVLADARSKSYRLRRGESVGNITVVRIEPTRVVFSVMEFGVGRQEVLSLKNDNETEGA
jgi:hypothetical protein